MTETIDVGRLHVSTCDVTPRNIDWSRGQDEGEEPHETWQSFSYEHDRDGTFTDYTLVAAGGSVVAVVFDGTAYESWEEWDEANPSEAQSTQEADMEEQFGFTEEVFAELMEVEPYQYGAEGPMMNYWYPIEETREYGRFAHNTFDPVAAAAKLDGPLCLVLVDDEYGLALTGGGMDLSWEICDAFVQLGKCPPLHFLDLPHMADTWRDMHQRVYLGAQRTLEFTINHANRVKERLDDYKAKQTGASA